MSDPMNYIYHLTEELGARPANTEEEYYAATEIEKMMKEHGIETALQEFPIPVFSNLAFPLLFVLMVFCALFAQLHWVLSVVCMVLSLVVLALYLCEFFDKGIISRLSHNGASQNVIGRHAGSPAGPNKRPRPVVIIANYDSPKADILKLPFLASFEPYIHLVCKIAMFAVPACLFIKSLGFMPDIIKPVLWVLALIFSIPLLVKGVFGLIQHFALGYVQGANDNLSGFAAMMGVLDRVQPYRSSLLANAASQLHSSSAYQESEDEEAVAAVFDEAASEQEGAVSDAAQKFAEFESQLDESVACVSDEQDAQPVQAASPAFNFKRAVRRGAGVARAAGVVPAGAQLIYTQQEENVAEFDDQSCTEQATSQTPQVLEPAAVQNSDSGQRGYLSPAEEQEVRLRLQAQAKPAQGEPIVQPVRSRFADLPIDYKRESEESTAQDKEAAPATPVSPSQSAPAPSLYVEEEQQTSVEDISDWGKSQFRPQAANLSLLDIPDPSVSAVDPYNVTDIHPIGDFNPQDFPADEFKTGTFVVPEEQRSSYELVDMPKENAFRRFGDKLGSMFSKKDKAQVENGSLSDWLGVDDDFNAKKDGRKIGSWDNFSEDEGWRGGATRIPQNYDEQEYESYVDEAAEMHLEGEVAEFEDVAYEDSHQKDHELEQRELRDVVMSLDDSELTSHEIWFVATGGSSYNHEGIKQFLREYKNELRGAFVIHVRGVGAGQLSVIGKEGASARRNGDRRLLNLIRRVGKDFARHVDQADMQWTDTEATPMMRAGYRSVSLMGLKKGVVPYSGWSGDTVDKLDTDQITTAVDIIAETIRRS